MARNANIKTLDIVQDARQALANFGEEVRMALSMARSDMQRMINRLQGEETSRWKSELKNWNKKLAEAKTDLYRAQIQMQDARERPVEQLRAVERAQRRVDEAEWKLARIKHWVRELDRQMLMCRGQLQSLDQAVELDLPRAAVRLDQIVSSLEAYVSLRAPETTSETPLGAMPTRHGETSAAASPSPSSQFTPSFTLDPAQRDAVTLETQVAVLGSGLWQLNADDAATLETLDLPIDPPFPDDRVLVSRDALAADTIQMHRADGSSSGDSGWLIVPGSCDSPPDPADCVAVPFAAFAKSVPSLEPLAVLPRGTLVKLERGRLVALRDGQGQSSWQHERRA